MIVPVLSYGEKLAPKEQEGGGHRSRAAVSRCVLPGMKCMGWVDVAGFFSLVSLRIRALCLCRDLLIWSLLPLCSRWSSGTFWRGWGVGRKRDFFILKLRSAWQNFGTGAGGGSLPRRSPFSWVGLGQDAVRRGRMDSAGWSFPAPSRD